MSGHYRQEVHPAARREHLRNLDTHGIAHPQHAAGLLPDECGALLVERPPLAAELARRQEPLETLVAEADEHARADHAHDLAVPVRLRPALAQHAFEQKREAG